MTPAQPLGRCPKELVGAGRDLWRDAVAHLTATGRSRRVYRTPLRIVCRLVESLEQDAGLNRIDACRRWLHEMGLTIASAPTSAAAWAEKGGAPEAPNVHDTPQTGRAQILSLIAGKKARA